VQFLDKKSLNPHIQSMWSNNKKLFISLIIGLVLISSGVIYTRSQYLNQVSSKIHSTDSLITPKLPEDNSVNSNSALSKKESNSNYTVNSTNLTSPDILPDINVVDISSQKPESLIDQKQTSETKLNQPITNTKPAQKETIPSEPNQDIAKYKVFEGNQWKELFEQAKNNYSNITMDYTGLNYFGEEEVNQVVIELATKRGFVKRAMVEDLGQLVYLEGLPLQPKAADALKNLFKEMRDEGHSIVFLSGFRGIVEQSQVFGDEFYKQSINSFGREISNLEILQREGDNAINRSYDTVALPGYSRHHFGYTVDLTEAGTYYKDFANTASYEWMSKDNFYNVKKHGIIPSYPKGVEAQGPEPESWEFVYVGREVLLK
jgi:hypothetical protein